MSTNTNAIPAPSGCGALVRTAAQALDPLAGNLAATLFGLGFVGAALLAAAIVLIPGAPLIKILFLSQALNAVLLLVLLPFMRSFGQDESLMGTHALGSAGRVATGVALALIVVSVLSLAVLTVAK